MRFKYLLTLVFLLLLASVSGCSAFSVVNAVSPSRHYVLKPDISYGGAERQRYDVYAPANRTPEALIVFFYGGGWTKGSKDDYRFVASALTGSGYAVVIPDYRLHPAVTFPAFVEDGAAAVAEILSSSPSYGIPSDRVFLMGHSAGAHIAAMLAYDERFLQASGVDAAEIDGFIGLSGPYDFLPIDSGYLEDVFPAPTRTDSQPIRFADSDSPPSLLIHGTDDGKVYPSNSESLASELELAGVYVQLHRYQGAGHARTVAVLAPPLQFLGDTIEHVQSFVRTILDRAVQVKGQAAEASSR